MKLIYCLNCDSVVRLVKHERACECGRSGGMYKDKTNAEFYGEDAVPIGFATSTLRQAIKDRPHDGMGSRFTAFVIPTVCDTMKYKHYKLKSVQQDIIKTEHPKD